MEIDDARRWRTIMAVIAGVLTVGGFVLPWWPSDFNDRSVASGLDLIRDNNWTIVSGYGWIGYLVHPPLVLLAIWAVRQSGRWQWLTLAGAAAGLWQFIGVRGATLINTTFAPYLGFVAMFFLLGALAIRPTSVDVRSADRSTPQA